MEIKKTCLMLFIFVTAWSTIQCGNKYSAEMNIMPTKKEYKAEDNPFRMYKVNLLWDKAQKRLAPEKLKTLYSDLKMQDNDEMTLKKMKSDGGDKEGLKEAELRKRFKAIMDKYGLREQFDHVEDALSYRNKNQNSAFNEATEDEIAKRVFKDKKLNKLWDKAEKSGFTEEELKTLKQELSHHQEKLEEYNMLVDKLHARDDNLDNTVDRFESTEEFQTGSKKYKHLSQSLKEKHEEVKKSYDRLSKMTLSFSDGGFEEVRVQELWKLAKSSNFTEEELDSLKEELQHYEHRIKKLKHLQSQIDFNGVNEDKWLLDQKPEERKHLEQRVKQYEHKVDKVHNTLRSRIVEKHIEL